MLQHCKKVSKCFQDRRKEWRSYPEKHDYFQTWCLGAEQGAGVLPRHGEPRKLRSLPFASSPAWLLRLRETGAVVLDESVFSDWRRDGKMQSEFRMNWHTIRKGMSDAQGGTGTVGHICLFLCCRCPAERPLGGQAFWRQYHARFWRRRARRPAEANLQTHQYLQGSA